MNRYEFITAIKTETGKSRFSTLIIPNIPENTTSDIYIRTTSMERLDKLALNFYDDTTMWPIIAAANGLGKGTIVVPPNTRLRIPNKTNITNIIVNANKR
jgi:hypothetical protein